ncbi:lytic transglycosylase domain-containing protein [Herbaspirillum robiniae]|uniref:Transglycosylase SLT domain-containing protein n=1 Tax=Herbaspirillum robiniae TaxID=2014887 RepID=A0ABX2LSJ5_9BURK|nr:lytic transglycosylase domain-containing protein [Herbaspirillum robiniae]NUU00758.1 transglycosylase SLT domain-containing protein [Herbaspirillum robiniae]
MTGKPGMPARTLLMLGAGLLLCLPAAQAQRMLNYTDADGVVHSHAESEPKVDAGKSIVYRYTDAQGVVHFYAERVDDRDRLMASSAALLNHPGGKDGAAQADPPFVKTMMAHPDARKYDALLSQASAEFGVDASLLKAVMTAESGFNARAVSSKGAVGLMQVLPATAERYGLQGDRRKTLHQKLTDPKINIRLAARYLRDLMAMFPQHAELAVASYNAGEGAVQKYGNKIPPYPETQGYVRLVSRFYQLYRPAGPAELAATGRGARLKVTLPPHAPGAARSEAPSPQAIAGADASLNDQHD